MKVSYEVVGVIKVRRGKILKKKQKAQNIVFLLYINTPQCSPGNEPFREEKLNRNWAEQVFWEKDWLST